MGDGSRGDPDGWTTWREAAGWFVRGRTLRSAGPIALVVGTFLAVVNQGGLLLSGDAGATTWIRVGVDYLVPFAVASAGWLSARRAPQASGAASGAGTRTAPDASDRP